MSTMVITRHSGLVEYLHEIGIIEGDAEVVSHVTEEQVRGRHVIGVLPLHLAACAASVTEIPLTLAAEDRGRDLPLERVREIAGAPRTYVVREVAS